MVQNPFKRNDTKSELLNFNASNGQGLKTLHVNDTVIIIHAKRYNLFVQSAFNTPNLLKIRILNVKLN